MIAAKSKIGDSWTVAPATKASAILNGPATSPFNSTICNGSASETLRVKLLSRLHATHAPTIAIGPTTLSSVGVPAQDRMMAAKTRHAMPSSIRRSKYSRKTNRAIRAVPAPSSARRSDAVAAPVLSSPHIKRSGPRTPPAAIAATSHGASCPVKAACGAAVELAMRGMSRRTAATPIPAPQ